VSLFGNQARDCSAYVPGSPGYQYLHKKTCPFVCRFGTLEVYYNRAWAEGYEASGQKTPGQTVRPDQELLQLLDLSGLDILPERCFQRGQWTGCRKARKCAFFWMPWIETGESGCPRPILQAFRRAQQAVNCRSAIVASIPLSHSCPP
jgi:hypothetical protein